MTPNARYLKTHREKRKAERDRMTKALKAIEAKAFKAWSRSENLVETAYFGDIHRLAKEGLGDE